MRVPLILVPAVLVALAILAGRALFSAGVHVRLSRADRLVAAGDVDESGRVLDRVQAELAVRRVQSSFATCERTPHGFDPSIVASCDD